MKNNGWLRPGENDLKSQRPDLAAEWDYKCIRRSPTAVGAVLNGRSAELRRPVRTSSILS